MSVSDKSGVWITRLEQSITALIQDPATDINTLFATLWEKGIMDRLDPPSPMEKQAREEAGSAVWTGNRNDAELLWRIAYAAAAAEKAILRNLTIASTGKGYIAGALQGFWFACYTLDPDLDPDTVKRLLPPNTKGENPALNLIRYLLERARTELKSQGVVLHDPLIPIGTKGKFHGIDVTVGSYTDQGLICLQAANREGHRELYQYFADKSWAVSPSEMTPNNWHPT